MFLIAALKSERIVSDQLETTLNEQPYIVGYSCWAIKFYEVLLNVPVIAKWTKTLFQTYYNLIIK